MTPAVADVPTPLHMMHVRPEHLLPRRQLALRSGASAAVRSAMSRTGVPARFPGPLAVRRPAAAGGSRHASGTAPVEGPT